MKNIKIVSALAALVMTMTACDDKLDIVPKGKTTLTKIADVELLLNQEFGTTESPASDLGMICNDAFPAWDDANSIMASPYSLNYANFKYDESVDRVALTVSDSRYTDLYKHINYMNVVIEKAAEAPDGDAYTKARIIAEAKVLRAYFHYLLVGVYAAQYDAATAAELGGVPYVTDTDVSSEKTKRGLAEVYDLLLEDCADEVIADLKDYVNDVCRVDKAFGNAVRAKVMMQMKRYPEALAYAKKALEYNNKLEDRSTVKTTGTWGIQNSSENNYLYMCGGTRACPTYATMPPESVQYFDENDYVRKYETGWSGPTWDAGSAISISGLEGGLLYANFGTMYNNMGIRTENMYAIIAECLIRAGEVKEGLEYVDRVRLRRIENPELWAQQSMTKTQAMEKFRQFHYVEFFVGYDNFFMMKRWNSEPEYARNITRTVGDQTFTLKPDSKLWILPFPANATRYNPSLTQNF